MNFNRLFTLICLSAVCTSLGVFDVYGMKRKAKAGDTITEEGGSKRNVRQKTEPEKENGDGKNPKESEERSGKDENVESVLVRGDAKIVLGDRPESVQAAVDKAFEKNKNTDDNTWGYNGNYNYGLLGLDDDLVLKNLASHQKEDDIYIIDVGGATSSWGYHAMYILLEYEKDKKTGKRYHIFSVTGGKECKQEVVRRDNVTLYLFNQFKIENIDEAFSERGFDLKNKVHLIVSNWTLRHLVDPFGTLKRMYNLLTPLQGRLMSTGFFFACDDSDEVQCFPAESWNILANGNAVPLFYQKKSGRHVGDFLLMRNNMQDLAIPLEYTGKMRQVGEGHQCASRVISGFKKGLINKGKSFCFKEIKCVQCESKKEKAQEDDSKQEDGIGDSSVYSDYYYCDEHNQLSKDLYARLKRHGLLCRPFFCSACFR